ncbi:MAG: FliA/WhiG family RNA polymerase sigma factor [bacterium]
MPELKFKNLWFAYWQDRSSNEAMTRLMEAWEPLVHSLLARIAIRLPSHVSREDLLQAALIGLYSSIDRFKPDMENGFEAFASHRIRGAMLDELRKNDYISRGLRARLRKVESAIEESTRTNGLPPEEEQLAGMLGMSQDELTRTLDSARPWLSLDQTISSESTDGTILLRDIVANDQAEDPADEASREDMYRCLRKAFRSLTAREQKILYLYYYEDLRLKEIAKLFEITEGRICQIHALSILRLKAVIKLYNQKNYQAAS